MCKQCESILLHNHTDRGSNLKLRDTTNRIEGLIKTVNEMGHKGLAITDHESISSHPKAIQITQKLKDKKELPEDFKLILGNEIYLVDSLEEVRDSYQGGGVTKFPHFLIIAKNEKGHEQLRILSSKAWEQSFSTGFMLRTPTTKSFLKQVIEEDKGNLIASTACLGSEICIHLLNMKMHLENNDRDKAKESYIKGCNFISWGIEVFGKEDFYLELQPAYSEEQIYCNKHLLKLAEKFNLKYIITTDSHYYRPEDRVVHRAFLNAKDAEREIDSFYEATFVQNHEEISERLNYLDHDIIKNGLSSTIEIGNKVENYTILHDPIIPKIELPEFELSGFFKSIYSKYEYINKMAHSENEQDRYMIKLLEDGFKEYLPYKTFSKERLYEHANRINMELEELWSISIKLNQALTSYYITVKTIVDIIWNDECGGNSLVGASRGSAMGYLICYLLGITQVSPLDYEIELPHWRHATKERPELSDVDLDSESSKRENILKSLRDYFGEKRVLQVATFGTEASKSAVQTAARGLGIDNDKAMYVSGLIPFERGANWELNDCLNGNEEKERKPVTEFINEIGKYDDWLNVAMKIEGLINKRSIHASGVIVFNEDYYKTNALMTAPNGTPITQFSLDDCEAVSNVKFDLLTIEGLDKIRVTLDHLLKAGEIQWQGSLRKTYDKYLHPSIIDIQSKEVYDLIASDSVVDLFQFSTQIGIETVKKTKPNNLIELSAANSLMRLMGTQGNETPIDSFIKFKNDINEWYSELNKFKLNQDEISVLEKHLLPLNGVADTQESVMLLSMDKSISGFSIEEANKLRKTIAKKQSREIEEIKKLFYKKGEISNTRKEMLDYIWNVQIVRQLGYSFSVLHTLAYSLIALQEANLNLYYNPLYWQTACLTVNSASMDDDEENEDKKDQSTNYDKIASAIGNLQSKNVNVGLPNINKAEFGFTPDIKENVIIFGLKGINGVGDDLAFSIIKNRPYNSFEDFIERMYDTGIVKKSQMLKLIKSGCFEDYGDRIQIMKNFIEKIFEPKLKLTMANLSGLIENNLIPNEYEKEIKLFNFRKYVTKKTHSTLDKEKMYLLDEVSFDFFQENFSSNSILEYIEGYPLIKESKFKKEYEEKMIKLKEWITLESSLIYYNSFLLENEWNNLASGTVSQWEMEALSFYYSEHELVKVPKTKYKISDFSQLPENPEISEMMRFKNGTERPKFKLSTIMGTVLGRNKNSHTVSLLTTEGVVTVKYYDGAFSHYNQQVSKPKKNGGKEIVEKTWFNRGNKIIVQGYRRGSQFKPAKYKDSLNQNTTMLITNVSSSGELTVKKERG